MTFGESIKTCFQKYAVFSGRASRSEFWWWGLFSSIVISSLWGVFGAMGGSPELAFTLHMVWLLGVLLPNLAVFVRRLHDVDWRGWWILFPIPIYIVLVFFRGTQGENRFGPDPLAQNEEPSS